MPVYWGGKHGLSVSTSYPSLDHTKHIYFILDPSDLPEVLVVGCQGSGAPGQQTVAQFIKQWLDERKPQQRAGYGLLLGDNFYESGLPNPGMAREELIRVCYTTPYASWNLCQTPQGQQAPQGNFFLCSILGNHDYGLMALTGYDTTADLVHGARRWSLSRFTNAFFNQYPPDTKDRGRFQVDLGVPGWAMPHPYYAVVSPKWNTVFFMIDSPQFLFDQTQRTWLRETYSDPRFNGFKKILLTHHPLLPTGKRALSKDRIEDYRQAFFKQDDPNTYPLVGWELGISFCLRKFLRDHDLYFNVVLCAHEHLMAVNEIPFKEGRITVQITSGGGGGDLAKEHESYAAKHSTHFGTKFLRHQLGFASLNLEKNTFQISCLTGEGKNGNIPLDRAVGQAKMTNFQDVLTSSKKVIPGNILNLKLIGDLMDLCNSLNEFQPRIDVLETSLGKTYMPFILNFYANYREGGQSVFSESLSDLFAASATPQPDNLKLLFFMVHFLRLFDLYGTL
jgi:hypothetical protein